MVFETSSYNYEITDEYIAQHPTEKRDASWLMVLDRKRKTREHRKFSDILEYLNPNDLLILNNTKVIPARLFGRKVLPDGSLGARCEFLLLRDLGEDQWEVLVRPAKRLGVGTKVEFSEQRDFSAEILSETDFGGRKVKFTYTGKFYDRLDVLGQIPLPPYIKQGEAIKKGHSLAERYQTVFASELGSAAAPTAGLHFTEELLQKVKEKGVGVSFITLHTSLGTFRPIKTADIREHVIHSEWYSVSPQVVEQIKQTKSSGGRVIAVGTTVVRVLESIALGKPLEGFTDIYIYPGFKFKLTDAMITNFHLPMSTLLVLVAAFAGKEFVMDSYLEALKRKYRFYSFGDAMFIY